MGNFTHGGFSPTSNSACYSRTFISSPTHSKETRFPTSDWWRALADLCDLTASGLGFRLFLWFNCGHVFFGVVSWGSLNCRESPFLFTGIYTIKHCPRLSLDLPILWSMELTLQTSAAVFNILWFLTFQSVSGWCQISSFFSAAREALLGSWLHWWCVPTKVPFDTSSPASFLRGCFSSSRLQHFSSLALFSGP